MRTAARWSSSCRDGSALPPPPLLLLLLLLSASSAQAQKALRTDPVEANALDAVFTKLNVWPMPPWWSSEDVDPCVGAATEGASMSNPGVRCDCSDHNNTVCHIVELQMYALNAVGPIPEELRNLTHLTNLNLGQNYLTGPLPSFLGELTAMKYLYIDSAGLSGPLPSSFSRLTRMKTLWASDNDFTGQIPDFIGTWANLTDLWVFFGPNACYAWLGSCFELVGRNRTCLDKGLFFLRKAHALFIYIFIFCRRFQGNSFQGPIPTTLSKLVQLTNLRIGDIQNGSFSLVFISNMTYLETLVLRNCMISDSLESVNFSQFAKLAILDLSFNNITGQVPQSLMNLNSLNFLFLGNNSLSGSLPRSIGPSLTSLDFSYNQLSGNFPSWASQNLQLNLVANNFMIDNSNNSVLPSGLRCLQRNTPCFLGSPQSSSFAVACGSSKSISASDNSSYQPDDAKLGSASYYVREAPPTWGVSNVGRFMDASNGDYTIYSSNVSYTIYTSSRKFRNTQDSELFQNARMSPSSLRYFGVGLENENYIVTLQFAEFFIEDSQTWRSLGKRVFDIYIQGEQKEQNFDIRKAAKGSYAAVQKQYIVPVTRNFLEIHLFWAGKGTCCIPTQGYYGPSLSALSVTLAPKKNKNKIGVIVGVVVGTIFIGLVLAGLHVRKQKSRKLLLKQQELYNMVGRSNVLSYSYGELKTAVQNFSSSNLLGEGGYGSVYKGTLSDGSVVAVKQLSETSHQGTKQFIAEIETISQVQHRNLVKLNGFCLEGNKSLLVYEYLENGSLDKALFGSGRLNLDWPTRYEICMGIARGLAYLHEESNIRVVHRDIKASNVLLDANLNPKISDFGLAKLYDDKRTHVSTKVAGTFGYLAPEYAMRGHMTEKVDVFAFGVVVLEIIAGRTNYDGRLDEDMAYLLEWVWQLYEEDRPLNIVDRSLTEFNDEEVLRAIRVGLLCIQSSPRQRPTMSRVVSMLAGDMEVAETLTKPSYVTEWQINGGQTSLPSTAEAAFTAPLISSTVDEGR